MAHDTTHHHESNAKRIWTVFVILSIITIVEVIFGIVKPDFLTLTYIFNLKLINWIFIILTLVKAYYIVWAFMHMEGESKGLRRAVVWTAGFLIIYLVFVLLTEGGYVHDVLNDGHVTWDF
ncbi:MAG: cytochrome C oxidase subunit IV family protein [Salinimicrobium sp.]